MKNCYDCKQYPTCYARIQVDELVRDLISRFWLELNSLDKVYKVIATHCSHYIKKEEE